ncbi:hypothetical protein ILYODFUR_035593 [Ilyodon furcidens]|uniref:Uncharacterized protein n=1 Tax=Ilyodon furcidens TaxID=33524 RepID=A0ABV0TDV7_9TELE
MGVLVSDYFRMSHCCCLQLDMFIGCRQQSSQLQRDCREIHLHRHLKINLTMFVIFSDTDSFLVFCYPVVQTHPFFTSLFKFRLMQTEEDSLHLCLTFSLEILGAGAPGLPVGSPPTMHSTVGGKWWARRSGEGGEHRVKGEESS